MTENEPKALTCPFCGAPYRKFVPPDVLQIECQYCKGTFLVPPAIGEIFRCPNHYDKLAIGICNDCQESFCGKCLYVYNLITQGPRATLYLCSNCLRKRYTEKAKGIVYVGIFLLIYGLFLTVLSLAVLIIFVPIGVIVMLYGFSKRSEVFKELTIDEVRAMEEKRKAELAEVGVEGIDFEEMYNKLLSRYVSHWGALSGTELLNSEIMAHVRHGASFPEAVKKVYLYHEKKPSKKPQ